MNRSLAHGSSMYPLVSNRWMCLLYYVIWIFGVSMLVPSSATAQVFKCMQNGQFVFQSVPCHPSQGEGVEALSCPKSSLEYERIIQRGRDTTTDRFCVAKARDRERRERIKIERQLAIEQKELEERKKKQEARYIEQAEEERKRRAREQAGNVVSRQYSFSLSDRGATQCRPVVAGMEAELRIAAERRLGTSCTSSRFGSDEIILHCQNNTMVVYVKTNASCESARSNMMQITQ